MRTESVSKDGDDEPLVHAGVTQNYIFTFYLHIQRLDSE